MSWISSKKMAPTSAPRSRESSKVVDGRSTGGCWTCRLRKKKCDETHPMCTVCCSLDIPCYGYGLRPNWMNGGPQEKLALEEIKRLVNLSVRRRLRNNATRSFNNGGGQHKTHVKQRLQSEEHSQLLPWRDFPTPRNQLATSPPSKISLHKTGHNVEQSGTHLSSVPTGQSTNPPSTDPPPTTNFCMWPNNSWDVDQINQGVGPGLDKRPPTPVSSMYSPECPPDSSGCLGPTNALGYVQPLSLTPTSFNNMHFDFGSATAPGEEDFTSGPYNPATDVELHDRDMSLLACYLDNVFHTQFPFYSHRQQNANRGWLFSLVMDRGPSYHACLSLSACYQLALLSKEQPGQATAKEHLEHDFQRHSTLAIRDMQSKINQLVMRQQTQPIDSKLSVNLLFSILQLSIFSLDESLTNWHMHLQASSTLLPQVLITETGHLSLFKERLDGTQAQDGVTPPFGEANPYAYDGPAVRLLTGAFVWLDIIISASTCKPLRLNLDHVRLLEDEVDMVSLVGCYNWAVAAVARVCEMHEWKDHLVSASRLSTRTLVERAVVLEARIENQATQMLENDRFEVVASACPSSKVHMERLITALFALGARIYLHVLVSGPLPELPEIKSCVGSIIRLMSNLPNPWLLTRVLWPFYVAGCLATESDYNFFTSTAELLMAQAPQAAGNRNGKIITAMKECWTMRQRGGRSCMWTDAPDAPWLMV